LEDNSGLNAAGAARVEEHPLLGSLPTAAPVAFTFDGRLVIGREGEPIAAALLAAGVRVFRTMPRLGDSRGGYCMIGRCADCFVVVDGVPNIPACVTSVSGEMRVQTQHGLGEAQIGSHLDGSAEASR
jgi:hypothetical protein